MGAHVSIDIDQHTADVLEVRAAELGVTIPQLIAELAALDSTPRDGDAGEIAELDRRAARATPDSRVPQERVFSRPVASAEPRQRSGDAGRSHIVQPAEPLLEGGSGQQRRRPA